MNNNNNNNNNNNAITNTNLHTLYNAADNSTSSEAHLAQRLK